MSEEAAAPDTTEQPQQPQEPQQQPQQHDAEPDPSLQPHPDPLDKIEPPGTECDDTPEPPPPKRVPDPFAYRHYTTYHPCCNKLLAMKWDQTLRQQHLKKLSAAKATIDNSAPKPYMHLQVKLKKLQMEEDRLALIERNNRILLEKMSHIMEMEAKDPNIHGDRDYTHSLSAAFRAREMAKIRDENRALLGRLEAKQPHYDHIKWIDERMRNLAYLQNISSYPQRFIDLRKEIEKQVPMERYKRTKGNMHAAEKLHELRAVFMNEGTHAKLDASDDDKPKQDGDQDASQKQVDQDARVSVNRYVATKAGKTNNGRASKPRATHRAVTESKVVAKPKTPVAEVDRVASERALQQSEPLPDIAQSSGERLQMEASLAPAVSN